MNPNLKLFPSGFEVSDDRVSVRGHDLATLIGRFGTPLIICDLDDVRDRIRQWADSFTPECVHYASKAFLTKPFARFVAGTGIGLDVASVGECHTALAAGFDPARILAHGNNKSDAELEYYVSNRVGLVVVDNVHELDRLSEIASSTDHVVDILLRVTPGVEAHTHEYLQTGVSDTKFGIPMGTESTEAARRTSDLAGVRLRGLHAHIGSQIFDPEPFAEAARRMVAEFAACASASGRELDLLDLGGGWGIRYTPQDDPAPISDLSKVVTGAVDSAAADAGIASPRVLVEPGRSIVGPAGFTVYTCGAPKTTPSGKVWLPVDGGMSDNIRPALYQARYTVHNLSRPNEQADTKVDIAGKLCESGDLLALDATLPSPISGEWIGLAATGAYCYAMASNYNRIQRPAVIGVTDSDVQVLARRETLDDLLRLDG